MRIETDVRRCVFIVETKNDRDNNAFETVRNIFSAKTRDFITAVDEKNIILVKEVKNGEGYELIIADVSSGDGRICAGSDIWRSGVAVSSGENDRSFDLRGGKNYKKLIP